MKQPPPRNVKTYNQHQMELFPPNVRSLIADDHLCIVVNDVIDSLDLSCLYRKVASEGSPPYHPAMMLKVLFYAYAKGIFSSRKIAAALIENVGFFFLAAWQKPDFRTISDFRKNNLQELGLLFAQVVVLCQRLGMVKLGHVSIDGTKIKANASDKKTYDSQRIEREISHWLKTAEDTDDTEDQDLGKNKIGDELPEDIRNQKQRLDRLKELKAQLEHGDDKKVNMTDPDAVFMKTGSGIKTAYNAQAAVDSDQQVIVAADVTSQGSDVEQLLPMIEQTEDTLKANIDECSADAGYSSGENLKALELRRTDGYIPDREYQAQQRGKTVDDFHKDSFVYDDHRDCYICIEGEELQFSHLQKRDKKEPLRIYRGRNCQACQFFGICTKSKTGRSISRHPYEKELRQMRQKLDSDSGKVIYGQRKYTVEPPFGHIKTIMGFTSFSLRGLPKVKAEFKLVSIAHNLRKIWLYLKANKKSLLEICPTSGY